MEPIEYDHGVAEALAEYARAPSTTLLNSVGPKVLACAAATGMSPYPWAHVRPVLLALALARIDDLARRMPLPESGARLLAESRDQLAATLPRMPGAPFTLQRFCEILLQPDAFYASSAAKLAYALEKLLRVTGVVADMEPADFARRVDELRRERAAMEQRTPAEPRGPVALDVDLRAPMPQLGLALGLGALPVKSAALELDWTSRVAQSQREQEQSKRAPGGGTPPEGAGGAEGGAPMDLSE